MHRTRFVHVLAAAALVCSISPVPIFAAPATPNPATYADPGPDVGDQLPETEQKALRAIRTHEGAPAGNTGQVTAGTTPGLIAGRAGRRSVTVRNTDATTLLVYVGFTAGVNASTGYLLKPGESVSIETTADLYVFAATGSPAVGYIETFTPPATSAAVTVQPIAP